MHQQVLRRVGIPMYSRERITSSRACRVAGGFLLAIFIAGPTTAATFVVDTTSDVILNACSVAAADCTLRGAIDAANTLSGADVIEFAIPASDPGCDADGICRIEVVSTLSISHALSINGYTQAGAQLNPLTGSAAPCTARAASEARKRMTSARSAGATQRDGSASGIERRLSGVSMIVGSTQLTLMPRSLNSAAIASVRRITADFDAV